MELRNAKLRWMKGEYGYRQGVKGSNNYPHKDTSGNWYNGYGGVFMHENMSLDIYGEDSDGNPQKIDVRGYLLEAIGRQRMNDALYDRLQSCIPEIVVVDDETARLSDLTLKKIAESYRGLQT